MIKIIDNFLPEEEFLNIKNFLEGSNFPWSFNNSKVHDYDGKFQFTHTFFKYKKGKNSDWLNLWNNFMNKIEAKECYRIKANMTLKTPSHEVTGWHKDNADPALKTSIFYINTNNGYTEFENGVRIESVSNRICVFDSKLIHRGVSHTLPDNYRIVVNFNYS